MMVMKLMTMMMMMMMMLLLLCWWSPPLARHPNPPRSLLSPRPLVKGVAL
jgi:hypothetical protein